MTQAEHDAMARVLADCAGQLVPTSEKEATVVAAAEASKAPEPAAEVVVVVPAPAAPAPEPKIAAPVARHPMYRRHRHPRQRITPTAQR